MTATIYHTLTHPLGIIYMAAGIIFALYLWIAAFRAEVLGDADDYTTDGAVGKTIRFVIAGVLTPVTALLWPVVAVALAINVWLAHRRAAYERNLDEREF